MFGVPRSLNRPSETQGWAFPSPNSPIRENHPKMHLFSHNWPDVLGSGSSALYLLTVKSVNYRSSLLSTSFASKWHRHNHVALTFGGLSSAERTSQRTSEWPRELPIMRYSKLLPCIDAMRSPLCSSSKQVGFNFICRSLLKISCLGLKRETRRNRIKPMSLCTMQCTMRRNRMR